MTDPRLTTIRLALALLASLALLACGVPWWYALAPVALFMPAALLSPPSCTPCTTSRTTNVQAVLSTWTDNACTSCSEMDGTYLLAFDFTYPFGAGECVWSIALSAPTSCNFDTLYVRPVATGELKTLVSKTGTTHQGVQRTTHDFSVTDCATWSGVQANDLITASTLACPGPAPCCNVGTLSANTVSSA